MAERPQREEYYMGIALAVSTRADCKGRKVGAVIVLDDRIISTGYNGTPTGMTNCSDDGCQRCSSETEPGENYDKCICVHAEENAIVTAAKFGISIEKTEIYTTMQPCFLCFKKMIQAGIKKCYYLHPWKVTEEFKDQYEKLKSYWPNLEQLDVGSEVEQLMTVMERHRTSSSG